MAKQSGYVSGESTESTAERTLNSKSFRNPDGTTSVKAYASPVHFRDEAGKLQEIDNSLVPTADGYKNVAGPQTVVFDSDSNSPELVKISGSDHQISFALQGARKVEAKVKDGFLVTYPGIMDGVDLIYALGNDSLKELVALHGPPPVGTSPTFRFQLNPGTLTPTKTKQGGIDLVDSKGTIVYSIPAATALDSSIDSAPRPPDRHIWN